MDHRKVIKFGKATYSMTLPKEWIVKQEVKKGDVLKVQKLPNGSLEVMTGKNEKELKLKEIDIDANNKGTQDIYREVIAAYIKNYTIIRIKGDVKGKIKELRHMLQELVGLEIMDVGQGKITAKSFIDVTQTNIKQTIKRVFYIIKSMSEEFTRCIDECAKEDEIIEMDREVNRNTFFLMKYLYNAIENPHPEDKNNMKNTEIIFTWELVKLLETIADKIKMMAHIAANKEVLIKKDARKRFLNLYGIVEKNFEATMEDYFKRNKKNVHSLFRRVDENEEKCNDFLRMYKKAWTPLLIDHLKDINMFTRGIAELIIDFE